MTFNTCFPLERNLPREQHPTDQVRFPMPPSDPVLRPQDGRGPSPVQMSQERMEERGPVSELSTPKGSSAGRSSPNRPTNSPQPYSPRGPDPSRSPRPNEVMPIQAAKGPYYAPSRTPPRSSDDLAQYWDKASKVSPKTTHGHNSDDGTSSDDPVSSVSSPSISELPTPQTTTPPSSVPRKAQLVPPSSSRRGAGASLYPQGASFSPIMEESLESIDKGRASIASSRVVPASWGSHPEDYDFNRIQEKFEEEEDHRNSPASPGSTASMHDDTSGLVRQASIGKKMKPSLTKIRSPSENVSNRKKETVGLAAITAGVAAGALGPSRERNLKPSARTNFSKEVVGNRTMMMDSSPSDSRSSSQDSGIVSLPPVEAIGRSRSPLASTDDRSARQPASPLFAINWPISRGPSVNEKIPSDSRPPHLDMEAVRDSDARGSVTSLPDLIRRATRLAANLNRGETASRLGMRDVLNSEKKEQRRRSGSISDILAAFPPPSRGTPDGTRSNSRWPSPFPSKMNRMSYLASQESGSTPMPQNRRRCCGMSLRTFFFIMLLLAILVAAAIVVPIALIVIPRQRQAAANDTGPSSLTHCPDSRPCQNGGFSVVSGDTCRCICVNGFTGDRCGTVTDPGCTTTDIATEAQQFINATLGNSIPRLLNGASTNYSIPLNGSTILSLFSTNNLSCTSENALVTFNNQRMKARDVAQKVAGEDSTPSAHSTSLLRPIPSPQAVLSSRLENRQVGTSNGIVFQMSATAESTPTSSSPSSSVISTSTSTSTASSSATSSAKPSSRSASPETIDFARIAVLFVLEQTGQLNTAVHAQDRIQGFLLNRTNQTDTMSLVSDRVDLSMNFANFSIALGNGTQIGGKGDGKGGIRNSRRKRSKNLWEVTS